MVSSQCTDKRLQAEGIGPHPSQTRALPSDPFLWVTIPIFLFSFIKKKASWALTSYSALTSSHHVSFIASFVKSILSPLCPLRYLQSAARESFLAISWPCLRNPNSLGSFQISSHSPSSWLGLDDIGKGWNAKRIECKRSFKADIQNEQQSFLPNSIGKANLKVSPDPEVGKYTSSLDEKSYKVILCRTQTHRGTDREHMCNLPGYHISSF